MYINVVDRMFFRTEILCDSSVIKAKDAMKDLHILEEEFSKYLQEAVSKSDDYKDRASKLMIELMDYERPCEEEYDIQESIIQ